MLSAPAHIPAITVVSFGAGLADPDLILGSACDLVDNRESPVWAAKLITGTSPAHDTDAHHRTPPTSAANLCDTCTGSAFPN